MEWKPIDENTPEDGTTVDIIDSRSGAREIDCYFDNGSWRDHLGERLSYKYRHGICDFTHWDYPPEPPK